MIRSGLTKDDVPPTPTAEALGVCCPEHPEGRWESGIGYDGGGFGEYKKCIEPECGRVFGKHHIRGHN